MTELHTEQTKNNQGGLKQKDGACSEVHMFKNSTSLIWLALMSFTFSILIQTAMPCFKCLLSTSSKMDPNGLEMRLMESISLEATLSER